MYYVYYRIKNDWYYERTCGSEWAAKKRVEILEKRYVEANYYREIKKNSFY